MKSSDDPEARIPARVIGWDTQLDLALIKAEIAPKAYFALTEAPELSQGQTIYAIGAPAGLESTITSGIVSALGRKLLEWGDSIQVDAALNPGNSGGPLVDAAGKVVGVVFAGMTGFSGLNFAIPLSWLQRDLPALYAGGKIEHSWLGLVLADPMKGERGVLVVYRHPSVPSLIVEDERIVGVDGKKIEKVADIQALLLDRRPGDIIDIRVVGRDGERDVIRVLGSRPDKPLDTAVAADTHDRAFMPLLGMSVKKLSSGIFSGENYTISSIRPGSIADEAGLSENDPFSLYGFSVLKKERVALIQLFVKKRKAGFLETVIQIPVSLEIPDFL